MLERAPATTCLAIEGLTKRFGGFYAVNDLQLEVATGDIHALIGPNGAGKTTFFNLVTGVLPADSGEIQFEGVPMLDTRASRRTLKGIARTFQNIRLFPHLTVLETVMIGEHCRAVSLGVAIIPRRRAPASVRRSEPGARHAHIRAHAAGVLRACRQARRQGVRPPLWRPAPARDGARARDPAAAAAARRAGRRHEPARDRRARRIDHAHPRPRRDHHSGRARHAAW